MRAIWSGEISFGLVTIPVKLYSATKDLTPSFNQLHKECGTKINMVRRCPKCARDIGYDEVGKGYEVSKGQYALFTKEELAAIEGEEGAGGVDIAEFVDPEEVDASYFDKSYWVGPAGRSSRGYELLHAALTDTKKAAVARVKIRSRTRLGLLRPRGRLFALDMMRYGDEMVPDLEIDKPEGNKPPSPREVQLALDLVKQLSGPFDPSKHPDQYRAAVQAAVDAKVEANQVKTDESTEEQKAAATGGQLIDLAEMLARSLRAVGPANAASPDEKPGPKKTTEETAEAAVEEKKPK
ncbi:MAG: non-homologous end joining protein Ku, partial [Polyangiales bacterium]